MRKISVLNKAVTVYNNWNSVIRSDIYTNFLPKPSISLHNKIKLEILAALRLFGAVFTGQGQGSNQGMSFDTPACKSDHSGSLNIAFLVQESPSGVIPACYHPVKHLPEGIVNDNASFATPGPTPTNQKVPLPPYCSDYPTPTPSSTWSWIKY